MSILTQLYVPEIWDDFLNYKASHQQLSRSELRELDGYIGERRYLPVLDALTGGSFQPPLPYRKELNKSGCAKKRIVYSYPAEFNCFLKMIAFQLYRYDGFFADNCFAFRRDFGVREAVLRIRRTKGLQQKYALKADIRNYFNAIDPGRLLGKLGFLREEDEDLYLLFADMLRADRAVVAEQGRERVVEEKRGAMAGTPVSPFFANVYLAELDHMFARRQIPYFRYSDDILILCDSGEELEELQQELYGQLRAHGLSLNPDKVQRKEPGEPCEFLGFRFTADGGIDLSETAKRKLKAKLRRKARALRRWSVRKGLAPQKAAKGFIRAMNRRFFDDGREGDFSWCRFYFPLLTTDHGLKEIDAAMQQNIRYCVTGRHYKGNYRISYEQMKEWGYRNLVHAYHDRDALRPDFDSAAGSGKTIAQN